jgi:hypothetical protein
MLNLRQLWRQQVPSGTTTIYVATTGSDSNAGTSAAPFLTITHAVSVAAPGTRILVSAGTYGYTSIYQAKGTAAAWISIESATDTVRPLISVADNSGDDGVDIQGSAYVGFYGFEVTGLQTSTQTGPSGICVFGASHHVRAWNNLVHDFPGGGVNCFYTSTGLAGSWDVVDVSFNTIYATSRYSDYNTSGISFYGAVDYTGTTWDGTYGYMAVGNYIYDVICLEPYTPGGDNFVTDGNGISFDSLNTANNLAPGLPSYTKRGLAEGNVVVGCGGRGLHIYNTINVDDFFNTYIGNLRTNSPAINNGVECDAQYDTTPAGGNGVVHYGNVICPLNTPNSTDGVSTYTNNIVLGGTQAVPSGNTGSTSTGLAYFAGVANATTLISGLAVAAFQPAAPNATAKQATARGYQALAAGARATTNWAAGAVELPLPVRVAV